MAESNAAPARGLRDPDAFYAALIDVHETLSPEQSQALNARLILLLVQALGDDERAHALLASAATDLRGARD